MHRQPIAQVPRAARVGRVIFVTDPHKLLDTVFAEAFNDSLKGLGAAFGGYKKSGMDRESHKMMLEHCQQTENVLVSYSTKALGFF